MPIAPPITSFLTLSGDDVPKDKFRAWALSVESTLANIPGYPYTFSTSTVDEDPGAGVITADDEDFTLVTELYVSDTDGAEIDRLNELLSWGTVGEPLNIILAIVRGSDGAQALFKITDAAHVAESGYVTLTVEFAAGREALADADALSLHIGVAGVDGEDGIDGTDGAAGVDGTSALTRVRVVSTVSVDIAGGGLAAGTTHDGVEVAENDLAILVNQTEPTENGLYVVPAAGAASRHPEFDDFDDLPGTYFAVMEGATGTGTLWTCTSARGGTIDVDNITIEATVSAFASDSDIANKTSGKALSPDKMFNPLAPIVLASSATPTPDVRGRRKFHLTFEESFVLQLPTNVAVGDEFIVHFTEDASGGATAGFAAGYVGNEGELPDINVGAGERTRVHFEVTAEAGGTATEVIATAAGGLWGAS